MKHAHRFTLSKIWKVAFCGLIVVGSTVLLSQASASPIAFQDDEKTEKVSLEPAEATGKKGVGEGDTCLNIKGKDIDGESFELSDYAGKVVMLDFWGDW